MNKVILLFERCEARISITPQECWWSDSREWQHKLTCLSESHMVQDKAYF